jgi:hypothetical protein
VNDEPTELELAWEHEIAREDARAVADELLAIVTSALEDAQVEVGRVLWKKACDEKMERVRNAPLVDAIADLEPQRLSRATQYRSIGVFLQAPFLPEETHGLLGPSRLYALLRLPNGHIDKKALARRAALSDMKVEELDEEIDHILGIQRPRGREQPIGTHTAQVTRSVKKLRTRLAKFVPKNQKDLDKRRAEVAALASLVQEMEDGLARVVVSSR